MHTNSLISAAGPEVPAEQHAPSIAADRLLTIAEVEHVTNLSRSTLYRLKQSGRFPRPWRVAGRSLWTASDLDLWFREERDRQTALGWTAYEPAIT